MRDCLYVAAPCRVTIQDLDNVEHTVRVTASSLFEAIALAISCPAATIAIKFVTILSFVTAG